jgi:hypothetical protein
LSNFILTLKLDTEKFQEDVLDKKFNQCRIIYNSCIGELYKRYNHMKESKAYKQNCKYKGKDRNKKFNEINNEYSLTEYSLYKFVKLMAKQFQIDANTTQKIASRAFNAFQGLIFHKANKVKFKKYDELYSFEGSTNRQGIRFRNNVVHFNKLNLKIKTKQNDIYIRMALENKIKYCRIKRTMIKGQWHYYVQLLLDGVPPSKINKETGEFKHYIDNTNSKIGIDIGTQTLAYCSDKEVKLLELAPEVNNIEKQKRILNRKLDRSRRSTNPNKYNENGTMIKGNKDKWIKSNRYIKTQNELKELQRKNAEIRKQSHNKLANYLLTLGTDIKVEQMNYKGLQRRSIKTTINEKTGKINKKKRFGKSLANKAPTMFLTILDNKLKWQDKKLNKINTTKVKASQYNHFTDKCVKKELSERWNDFGEFKVQRDLYSAFLIMNVKDNLNEIDREMCFDKFDNFKRLHDEEIIRIKNCENKLISSMGM